MSPYTSYVLSGWIFKAATSGAHYIHLSDIPGEQRWAPRDPNGRLDSARGIREIVVGTGGRDLDGFPVSSTHVGARDRNTCGVIKSTLHASSHDWQLVPQAGQTGTGSTDCH